MSSNVGAFYRKHTALAAAAVAQYHLFAHQFAGHFGGVHGFNRAVAGVVIQVLLAAHAVEFDAFFEQEFVDVNDAAAGEDVFKTVIGQRVVAGAAAYYHGFDVEVV